MKTIKVYNKITKKKIKKKMARDREKCLDLADEKNIKIIRKILLL